MRCRLCGDLNLAFYIHQPFFTLICIFTLPNAARYFHNLTKDAGLYNLFLSLKFRTMFWSDWGHNAKIESAYMDGSGRAVIVSGSTIGWPNGLAIDYSASRLYWVDAR